MLRMVATAEPDGPRHVREVAFHEDDVRRLDGHVRPRSDGDPDVRLGKGRCVVDAVPDHGHLAAFGLELLHGVRLLVRQHLGQHPVHADLPRNGLSGPGRCHR